MGYKELKKDLMDYGFKFFVIPKYDSYRISVPYKDDLPKFVESYEELCGQLKVFSYELFFSIKTIDILFFEKKKVKYVAVTNSFDLTYMDLMVIDNDKDLYDFIQKVKDLCVEYDEKSKINVEINHKFLVDEIKKYKGLE